jgi:hypothetical protein
MAGPFRLTGPNPTAQNIGKMPSGLSQPVPVETPAKVYEAARARGVSMQVIVNETRVLDGETPIPWPDAGPINDAHISPMRLTQG